nr:MAG: hypothetical protein [Sanya fiers-like virus 18]
MAQIANVVINDGQATPVAHTFNPDSIDAQGVARWADRSTGIAVGFPTLSLSLRKPTAGSRNYKMTMKADGPNPGSDRAPKRLRLRAGTDKGVRRLGHC